MQTPCNPRPEDLNAKARRSRRIPSQEMILMDLLRVLRVFAFRNLEWIDRKVLILSESVLVHPPQDGPSTSSGQADRGSRRVDLIVGHERRGWLGTRQNRRKTLRCFGRDRRRREPGVNWNGRLRGNSRWSWVELPTVGRRRGASWVDGSTSCGRRPDSFRC
jgi:hypothetical protein